MPMVRFNSSLACDPPLASDLFLCLAHFVLLYCAQPIAFFAFGPSTDITDYTIINYTPSAAELQPDIAHLPTHVRLQFAEATVLGLELAGELAEHPLAFS
jgi:hypothetical protein